MGVWGVGGTTSETYEYDGLGRLRAAEDEDSLYWRRIMLAEACRVKESVFFNESAVFRVTPPGLVDLGGRRRPGSGGDSLFMRLRSRSGASLLDLVRCLGDLDLEGLARAGACAQAPAAAASQAASPGCQSKNASPPAAPAST